MTNAVELNAGNSRKRAEVFEDIHGLCPICKATPIIRNIRQHHVGACDKHRVCWDVGSNLFSAWRHEDEQACIDNANLLDSYRKVEPYFFPRKRQATAPGNADLPF